MADEQKDAPPKRRRGRRRQRPSVPADLSGYIDPEADGDGSAGVREPRRPKPSGPLSGAGELPVPEPELVAVLPDSRQ